MKLLVDYIDDLDIRNDVSYLVGLEKFSYNTFYKYDLEKVKKIIKTLKEQKITVGVNLEKIMFDNDLEELKEILPLIMDADFITYSDLGVYQLIKELQLDIKTIYHASTLITNIHDILLMLEENENVILGKEISLDELLEIDKLLPKKVLIDAFGKFPIFTSRRKLLKTYFTYRNLDLNPNDLDYEIVEEFRNEPYPIVENDNFMVYDPKYYCLGNEIKKLNNINTFYLSSNFLTKDEYKKVIDIYLENNDIDKKLSIFLDIYKGKLEEKTILVKGGNN